ncbi:hypothetical protein C8Q74DRAFT_1372472 [Fomes fomentarius]|nr:hypothetical protein C8Q74DRAFT_1372472 [Fomes fomentarius]
MVLVLTAPQPSASTRSDTTYRWTNLHRTPAAAVLGSTAANARRSPSAKAVLRSSALRADDNDSEVVTTPAGRCSVAPLVLGDRLARLLLVFLHVNLGLLQSEANLWRSPNPAEWHSTPGFFGGPFATHNSSAAPGPVITEAQGQSPDIVRMF